MILSSLGIHQVLERSSAQGTQDDDDDDDVEEISTVQQRSEDEGPSEKAADPEGLSRPPTGSLRGCCPCFFKNLPPLC